MPFRSFTPEVRKILLQAVRDGEYMTSACRKARIGEPTLRHWLTIGENTHKLIEEALIKNEEPPELDAKEAEFLKFYLDVYEAEGASEGEGVKEIRTAGREGNWVATMTWMERRFGKRWRKTEVTEHVGPGGGPIQHEEVDNSPKRIAEILEVLQGAGIVPQGIKGLPAPADA